METFLPELEIMEMQDTEAKEHFGDHYGYLKYRKLRWLTQLLLVRVYWVAHNKKIKSLTSFAGTQTRGLLRIIAHMSAPLI